MRYDAAQALAVRGGNVSAKGTSTSRIRHRSGRLTSVEMRRSPIGRFARKHPGQIVPKVSAKTAWHSSSTDLTLAPSAPTGGDAHCGHHRTSQREGCADACFRAFVTGGRTAGLSNLRIGAHRPPGPRPAPRRPRHRLATSGRPRTPPRGTALRPLSAPRPRPGDQLPPVRGRSAGHRHRFRHRRSPGAGAGLAQTARLVGGFEPVVSQPFLSIMSRRRRRARGAGAAVAGRSLRAVRLLGPNRGSGRRRSAPARSSGAP